MVFPVVMYRYESWTVKKAKFHPEPPSLHPLHTISVTGMSFLAVRAWVLSGSVVSDSSRPRGLYLPGSSVHGILQAAILEWVAIPFFIPGCGCLVTLWSVPRTWGKWPGSPCSLGSVQRGAQGTHHVCCGCTSLGREGRV